MFQKLDIVSCVTYYIIMLDIVKKFGNPTGDL